MFLVFDSVRSLAASVPDWSGSDFDIYTVLVVWHTVQVLTEPQCKLVESAMDLIFCYFKIYLLQNKINCHKWDRLPVQFSDWIELDLENWWKQNCPVHHFNINNPLLMFLIRCFSTSSVILPELHVMCITILHLTGLFSGHYRNQLSTILGIFTWKWPSSHWMEAVV